MVVRFTPSPDEPTASKPPQRENLAEVVDIRSRLVSSAHKTPNNEAPSNEAASDETPRDDAPNDAPNYAPPVALAEYSERASKEQKEQKEQKELPDTHGEAVKLLSRKALSSGELRRELQRREHAENDIENVLADFIESFYLDDFSLARTLCEKLRDQKRASTSQIRHKLQERLLDRDAIDEALAGLDVDEENDLLVAAANDRARKLTSLDRKTAERRLLGFLARRGWGGPQAFQAAREALDEHGV